MKPALVWWPSIVAVAFADAPNGERYVIHEVDGRHPYAAGISGRGEEWLADTLDAAKAACERHWRECD